MIEAVAKQPVADEGGMGYLETLPRNMVVVYIPLAIFIFLLLFPFYWMTVTSFKTNEELHAYRGLSALWIYEPRSCRYSARSARPMPSNACATRARAPSAC
jgi:ABC-type glycerol-3-phosphate transport system permease component